jgi:hypothetical protein
MKLAVELVRATPSGRTVFYLLSDFRERNWQNTDSAKESIAAIARLGAEIRFIDCALAPAPNLAVTALEPLPDVWVAGVPVVFQVTVRNHSPTPVRNVNLSVRLTQYGGATTGPNPVERLSGKSEALPAVLFEQIPPRSEQTKQFQVFLASSGTHAVEVELPEDSVAIDNRRASTLPLAEAAKVLIIDGDVEGKGAYHVASVLDPGGQVRTGAVPEVRPPTFLRNSSLDTLREYRAIYLLDLPEIDANSQATLTDYVAAGGGLLWFIGPRAVVSQYNALLQNRDTPLLPAPLTEVLAMDASGASSAPDLSLGESHPVIAPFVSLGDAALSLVRVQRSMGMDLEQAATSPLTRLLNRRDGEPFVLQHDVGRGRIITVLGSLDSNWMNWTGDPTFVVFMLRANAFLWSAMAPQTARRVDEPFVVSGSQDEYSRMANYLPAVEVAPRIPIEKPGETAGETLLSFELNPLEAAIEGSADLDAMLNPGISELWLTRLDGTPEARLSAANISGMEGDLAQTEQTKIRTALQPVPVSFSDASEVIASDETSGGNLMALVLFAVLGLLLASEQILAYYASYHPPMVGARQ